MPKHYYESEAVQIPQIIPTVYNFSEINNWGDIFPELWNDDDKHKKTMWHRDVRRMGKYDVNNSYVANLSISFDTETTTITNRINKNKTIHNGYVYIWQCAIGDKVIIGRNLSEFKTLCDKITDFLNLGIHSSENNKGNIIYTSYEVRIWVANLGFDFQFFCKLFNVIEVFAKHKHNPLTVTTDQFIFFQDALSITNSSLAKIPDLYGTPTKKLKGDLDYNIIRNTKTKLTKQELQYCINDVVVLNEFNEWLIENYVKQKLQIPFTKTGILRDSVKKDFKEWVKNGKIFDREKIKMIADLLPIDLMENEIATHYLFRGGYTHSNAFNTNIVVNGVNGWDITSSYPAVILQEYYPMTAFKPVEINNIDDVIELHNQGYATFGKYEFTILRAKTYHCIESISKTVEYYNNNCSITDTIEKCNIIADNGRIRRATKVTMWLTDIDILNYVKFYDWKEVKISCVQKSKYDRLPDYLLKNVFYYYNRKAELKKCGLEDTTEYKIAKSMVNACYGMMCEHIHLDDIIYDNIDGWCVDELTNDEKEQKYISDVFGNKTAVKLGMKPSVKFLSPYWGIWVTAYGRYNILDLIKRIVDKCGEIGVDDCVIYCDTDSVYVKNSELFVDVVERYNAEKSELNKKWCIEFLKRGYTVDYNFFKDLGQMDKLNKHENYARFKTLGAKRYIKEHSDGKIEQTIAGLPKTALQEYCTQTNQDPFEIFESNMFIPAKYVHKNAHCYNENSHFDIVVDEQGNIDIMKSECSVGIFPVDFSLKVSSQYQHLIEVIARLHMRKKHLL